MIQEKFAGDDNLIEMLSSEIEKVISPEAGDDQIITDMQVKAALRVILQKQQQLFINQADDNDALIEEIQQSAGGQYAHQKIQYMIQSYRETGITTGDPFQELKDQLDLFYNDE